MVRERAAPVRQQAHGREHVVDDQRLEHVQLEVALRPGHAHGHVQPHDLHGHHGQGLALGGVDLAGHDGRAGFVLRQAQFADAATRAGRQPAHVVGDLQQGRGQRAQGAAGQHQPVVGGQRGKGVGRGHQRQPGHVGQQGDGAGGKGGMRVQAGAHCGAAKGQTAQVGHGRVQPFQAGVQLGHPAGHLVAQGQGHGVLQVGAAYLHDVRAGGGLGAQGITQVAHAGQQVVAQGQRGG
ncbi:hypothetical protein DSECCO2_653140 [anaerobic digester metagenome]